MHKYKTKLSKNSPRVHEISTVMSQCPFLRQPARQSAAYSARQPCTTAPSSTQEWRHDQCRNRWSDYTVHLASLFHLVWLYTLSKNNYIMCHKHYQFISYFTLLFGIPSISSVLTHCNTTLEKLNLLTSQYRLPAGFYSST